MSYFNPEWNISQIFLQTQDNHPFFNDEQDSFKNKNTQLDFTISDSAFSFDFFEDFSSKPSSFQQEKKPQGEIKRKKRIFKIRYEKNICGYILKKILRAFVHESYRINAHFACAQASANFDLAQKFCLDKMQKLNGISSPYSLLVPSNKEQIKQKQALIAFAEWFVQQRYVRHLIHEGKMKDKQKYIKFKNEVFLKDINRLKTKLTQFKAIFD